MLHGRSDVQRETAARWDMSFVGWRIFPKIQGDRLPKVDPKVDIADRLTGQMSLDATDNSTLWFFLGLLITSPSVSLKTVLFLADTNLL